MGTTLTGTTPQDTYDSLIKVTDNGPLSGTLKALSDGLGNDSTLSLSTTAASIAGTLAVTGNAAFDTSTLFVDAAANEVGVGTASPAYRFNVVTDAISGRQNMAAIDRTAQNFVTFTNPQFSADASMGLLLRVFPQSDSRQGAGIIASGGSLNGETDLGLFVSSGSGSSTSYSALNIIGSTGNVGIGTTAPDTLVTLGSVPRTENTAGIKIFRGGSTTDYATYGFSGNAVINAVGVDLVLQRQSTEVARFTTAGLCFGGDYLAANALDDYEEGAWTMGVSFGGGTTGITYGSNTGRYTKVGRIVTVSGYLSLSSKGSSTGTASLTGLPFSGGTGGVASCFLSLVTYTGTPQFVGLGSESTVRIYQLTEAGAITQLTDTNFSNTSEIYITYTFTV